MKFKSIFNSSKLLIVGILFFVMNAIGQNTENINSLQPDVAFDNVHVVRIAGDSLSTQFVIWVKDTVSTHHHVWHSESIYVLEGIAKLYFNDTIKEIQSGDLIFLPKNNNHAVKVISKTPLKVLSVQSPGFYGLDRVFINKE